MALKRDRKGRFLKRNAGKKKRRANKKATPRKRNAGLRGHKPGCRCVIHARRRASKGTVRRRAKAPARPRRTLVRRASPKRRRRTSTGKGPVAIQLSKSEAFSFTHGGPKIRRKVQLRAAGLLRTHGKVKVLGPTGTTLAHIHR